MFVKVDLDNLKREEREILVFFKKQVEEFQELKKICEKVEWNDALYNQFIDSMNAIGKALSTIIQTITNGKDVYLITEFMPYLQNFLEMAKSFPLI